MRARVHAIDDKLLRRAALGFRRGFLEGQPSTMMCFAICAPLQGWLSFAHKLDTKLEEIDFGHCNHYWLRLPDGRILDPTADQFSAWRRMPKVYLGAVPPLYQHWMDAAKKHNVRTTPMRASPLPFAPESTVLSVAAGIAAHMDQKP